MENSKYIAKLLGPTIIAILVSELRFVQPHLYDVQIPPVVYLSGTLFFISGILIIRSHNFWTRQWPVLITIIGWSALFLGLFRMFAAESYQQNVQNTSNVLLAVELIGIIVGIFLTLKAYSKEDK
ncbi:MAG: hypothetical protein WAV25_00480 [Minisyncoccia bacterium]